MGCTNRRVNVEPNSDQISPYFQQLGRCVFLAEYFKVDLVDLMSVLGAKFGSEVHLAPDQERDE